MSVIRQEIDAIYASAVMPPPVFTVRTRWNSSITIERMGKLEIKHDSFLTAEVKTHIELTWIPATYSWTPKLGNVHRTIRYSMLRRLRDFVYHYSSYSTVKNSTLHRWYRFLQEDNLEQNPDLEKILFEMWRHIETSKREPTRDANIINTLEFIQQKYQAKGITWPTKQRKKK